MHFFLSFGNDNIKFLIPHVINEAVMLIKRILSSVIVVTSITTVSSFTPTQAQQSCFLHGANGQSMDLGHLCGGQSSPRTNSRPAASSNLFQIPIKRRHAGIPVVDVTFNGQHTFEMLFDTGASGITITPDMASKMGVTGKQGAVAQTAGGTVPISIGMVSSVKSGQLVAENLTVSITPSLGGLGLLGQNFYGNYDVTIKQDIIEVRPRL